MKITKETIIAEIGKIHPNADEILKSRGMHCLECATAQTENLEHAALVHGFELENLIEELNKELAILEI